MKWIVLSVLLVLLSTTLASRTPVLKHLYPSSASLHAEAQRIVGGNPTTIEKYPFQAAIAITASETSYFQCGGTLIDSEWVLTAGHCVVDDSSASSRTVVSDLSRVRVGLGITNFDYYNLEYRVDFISIHPSYASNDFGTEIDMAMLHLTTEPTLSDTVQIVDLATSTDQYTPGATTATAIGWGSTSYGGPSSTVLREVQVPIVTYSACEELQPAITRNYVCAGSRDKDTCLGDSGGPLLIANGTSYIQVGLTSSGIVDATGNPCSGLYTFYTVIPSVYNTYIQPQIRTGPAPCSTCVYDPNNAAHLANWITTMKVEL